MEVKEKLTALQEFGDFKQVFFIFKFQKKNSQFVRLCHLQPDYGYEWLAPVRADFPQEGTICELKVGRRQLLFEYIDANVCDGFFFQFLFLKFSGTSRSPMPALQTHPNVAPLPFGKFTRCGHDRPARVLGNARTILGTHAAHRGRACRAAFASVAVNCGRDFAEPGEKPGNFLDF